ELPHDVFRAPLAPVLDGTRPVLSMRPSPPTASGSAMAPHMTVVVVGGLTKDRARSLWLALRCRCMFASGRRSRRRWDILIFASLTVVGRQRSTHRQVRRDCLFSGERRLPA